MAPGRSTLPPERLRKVPVGGYADAVRRSRASCKGTRLPVPFERSETMPCPHPSIACPFKRKPQARRQRVRRAGQLHPRPRNRALPAPSEVCAPARPPNVTGTSAPPARSGPPRHGAGRRRRSSARGARAERRRSRRPALHRSIDHKSVSSRSTEGSPRRRGSSSARCSVARPSPGSDGRPAPRGLSTSR
jgi:hypothetical protein